MKIARDKTFEHLLKQEKGKNTHWVCKINKRHLMRPFMQLVCEHIHSHEVNKRLDNNPQKSRQPDHKNEQWNGEDAANKNHEKQNHFF